MKKFILISLFPFLGYAAEKSLEIVEKKDIFEQFNNGKFVEDNLTNWKMEHTPGRLDILQHRIAEIDGIYLANEILHISSPDQAVLQTSNMYSRSAQKLLFTLEEEINTHELDYLRIFASYITFTEQALLALALLKKETALVFEQMRVHDLYLLSQIIKEDPLPKNVRDLYSLPEILQATHKEWPPKRLEAFVHPTSAYTVLIDALTIRKEMKIDDGNGDHFIWTFDVQKYTKKEYAQKLLHLPQLDQFDK